MRAGKLRHRIQLAQPVKNREASGEIIRDYSVYATVWALVEPLSGREFEYAQQISAETAFRIRIRYRSDVTTEHRIVFGDRTFELTAPPMNPEERNIELVLLCKEVS